MVSLRNFVDKLKRYFWFSKDEFKSFLITVFVLAFIFSFNEWGRQVFDLREGLLNLLLAIFVVAISVFVHHACQRCYALGCGFRAEHTLWWQGLSVAGVLAVVSNGAIKFLPGSALTIHHMPLHRLCFYRYGPKFSTFGMVALMGPLGNVLLAVIVRLLGVILPQEFVSKTFFFNLVFAAYNLLPIPPLDGSKLFFSSRLTYVFVFCAVVSYMFISLLAGLSGLLVYIFSLLAGFVGWFVFYVFFERKW